MAINNRMHINDEKKTADFCPPKMKVKCQKYWIIYAENIDPCTLLFQVSIKKIACILIIAKSHASQMDAGSDAKNKCMKCHCNIFMWKHETIARNVGIV